MPRKAELLSDFIAYSYSQGDTSDDHDELFYKSRRIKLCLNSRTRLCSFYKCTNPGPHNATTKLAKGQTQ